MKHLKNYSLTKIATLLLNSHTKNNFSNVPIMLLLTPYSYLIYLYFYIYYRIYLQSLYLLLLKILWQNYDHMVHIIRTHIQ